MTPRRVLNPVSVGLGQSQSFVGHADGTSQEEEVLVVVDQAGSHLHLDRQLESEQKLMLLEETAAGVAVDVQDVTLRDRLNLVLLSRSVLLRIVDGELEDVAVPFERELVHRVDLVEIEEYEEQSGGSTSNLSV